ncbi:hypothetical protein SCAB_48371 [Streptomyces scabiei 87.22]|uniref:Uncharacterized protein n=1 Tax=Streptomyces scabiei (strain 87.22) TaxID=680198 RepID=C9ZFA2_STRSW|nr:DUF6221 family protein [Streptomyces scabiei]MDX2892484.1 DUF6221 family protein [Streptomyces scabiei]MDX2900577.1 DUF6221 family protein [Streptomyces scabiei]MDX2994109.1 DUF6221 family protein [Streptomyces scabiei]MDX3084751.1 DUF6221 family protein [Streptomyces scabiei]MDX3137879.1 DUF6221 family protein [Streptomyces scabiei]
MDDMVQWLGQQLDEDERIARVATPGPWEQSGIGEYGWAVSFSRPGAGVEVEDSDQGRADADFIAAHDPARVLCEIDAKRRIIAAYENYDREAPELDVPESVLRLLALPYADRPGYREEWRP